MEKDRLVTMEKMVCVDQLASLESLEILEQQAQTAIRYNKKPLPIVHKEL